MKENINLLVEAQTNNNPDAAEKARTSLKMIGREVHSIQESLERDQVHVSPWMNVVAQQETMRLHNSKCATCSQNWITGSRIFNSDQAKLFLKKVRKGTLSKEDCESCGQRTKNASTMS